MSRHRFRSAIAALVLVTTSAFATPALAEPSRATRRTALTTVPVQTLKALSARTPPARAARAQSSAQSGPGFFKTGKGAVAIGLMAAGTGLTFWSISHDRKPVKSPIR